MATECVSLQPYPASTTIEELVHRSNLGRSWHEFSPNRPKFEDICQRLTKIDPISTTTWPEATKFDRELVDLGQIMAKVDQHFAKIGQVGPNLCPNWPMLAPSLSRSARIWSNPARIGPTSTKCPPKLVVLGQALVEVSSSLANSWQKSSKIPRGGPNLGQKWQSMLPYAKCSIVVSALLSEKGPRCAPI